MSTSLQPSMVAEVLGINAEMVQSFEQERLPHCLRTIARAQQMMHHPDQGGDPVRFGEIQQAAKVLSSSDLPASHFLPSITKLTALDQAVQTAVQSTERVKVSHRRALQAFCGFINALSCEDPDRGLTELRDTRIVLHERATIPKSLILRTTMPEPLRDRLLANSSESGATIYYERELVFDHSGAPTLTQFGRSERRLKWTILGSIPVLSGYDGQSGYLPATSELPDAVRRAIIRDAVISRPISEQSGRRKMVIPQLGYGKEFEMRALISVAINRKGELEIDQQGLIASVEKRGRRLVPQAGYLEEVARFTKAQSYEESLAQMSFAEKVQEANSLRRPVRPGEEEPANVTRFFQALQADPDEFKALMLEDGVVHLWEETAKNLGRSELCFSQLDSFCELTRRKSITRFPGLCADAISSQLRSLRLPPNGEFLELCRAVSKNCPDVLKSSEVTSEIDHYIQSLLVQGADLSQAGDLFEVLGLSDQSIDDRVVGIFRELVAPDSVDAKIDSILSSVNDKAGFWRADETRAIAKQAMRTMVIQGLSDKGPPFVHLWAKRQEVPLELFLETLEEICRDAVEERLADTDKMQDNLAFQVASWSGEFGTKADAAEFLSREAVRRFIGSLLEKKIDTAAVANTKANWRNLKGAARKLHAYDLLQEIAAEIFIKGCAQWRHRPDSHDREFLRALHTNMPEIRTRADVKAAAKSVPGLLRGRR
ncbi:MAG: hypothetical protein DCC75_09020 [Proteobacteria bacterium]|nr:MAG: hypothetical protein DCC75_09020 [Pseudomonadota bacterium]